MILGGLMLVTIPPLKDTIFCSWSLFKETPVDHYELIKNWCDFGILACQVWIAVMIGGVIFTDGISKWFRDHSESIQVQLNQITELIDTRAPLAMTAYGECVYYWITEAIDTTGRLTPRQQSLFDRQAHIERIRNGITLKNLVPKLQDALHEIQEIYNIIVPNVRVLAWAENVLYMPFSLNLIPGFRNNRLPIFLILRYAANFPGGVYGWFAFLAFLLMIALSTIKLYYDYARHC
jgi:hypothetical protein